MPVTDDDSPSNETPESGSTSEMLKQPASFGGATSLRDLVGNLEDEEETPEEDTSVFNDTSDFNDEEDEDLSDDDHTSEDEQEEDTDDVSAILTRYRTPEAMAKALREAKRQVGKQGQELGEERARAKAALDLVSRFVPEDKTPVVETEEPEDDGIPKDEYGIPRAKPSYWKDERLPFLEKFYAEHFESQGYSAATAATLAKPEAVARMILERDEHDREYAQKRAAAEQESSTALEAAISANIPLQSAAIEETLAVVKDRCARMGIDGAKASEAVLAEAKARLRRAVDSGQVSLLQASTPDIARLVISQAYSDFALKGDFEEFAPQKETQREVKPETRRVTAQRPVVQTRSGESGYSKRHTEFAKSLGITPEELERNYGKY